MLDVCSPPAVSMSLLSTTATLASPLALTPAAKTRSIVGNRSLRGRNIRPRLSFWCLRPHQVAAAKALQQFGYGYIRWTNPTADPCLLKMCEPTCTNLAKDCIGAAVSCHDVHHGASVQSCVLLKCDLAIVVVADQNPLCHAKMRGQGRIFSV